MIIEDMKFAPAWIKEAASQYMMDATAYAFFEMYDVRPETLLELSNLRDRTDEMTRAVKGMSGSNESAQLTYTGSQLKIMFGFDPVGASFIRTYRILFS